MVRVSDILGKYDTLQEINGICLCHLFGKQLDLIQVAVHVCS